MNPRSLVPAVLAACVAFGLTHPIRSTSAQDASRGSGMVIGGVRDTGQFLPDDHVIARVGDRRITAEDFVDGYYMTYAENRPRPDSAGRLEFLNSLIVRDVLGLLALEVDKPLGFEDRHELRTYEERVLSNVLFQRLVLDSIEVTDADIERVYQQYTVQVRLQDITFDDEATAARVRRDLLAGRITWPAAVEKYSTHFRPENPEGDVGWKLRPGVGLEHGTVLFNMNVGEISPPLEDDDGFHLMRCVEKKPYAAPSLDALYAHIRSEVQGVQIEALSRAFKNKLAAELGMTYDSSLVASLSAQFAPPRSFEGGQLRFNEHLPHIADEDTGKVLARYEGGRLTVGDFLGSFQETSPLVRPAVNTPDAMISQIQSVALEPRRVELARAMGLQSDSMALDMMRKRIEQLRVEKLYQDSVLSRVWVSSDDRRKYYDANTALFITYPKANYVVMYTKSQPFADSLAARIRGGEAAEDVLAAEQARGRVTGQVGERSHVEPGALRRLLFEEMREGETRVVGPDEGGNYAVYYYTSHDPGRQLSFSESQGMIDRNLQNVMAERLLQELVERHKNRYGVETHPELVMRIRLVDPFSDRD